ncbi:MAG TPA: carboxypeptidase-like regulatory domain-containing protein, partial [Mucilaginibacter sp.]|nr:carboxypeptidase-like regulatory domain-containing protein [Mucilaginibacter sp.]
MKKLILLILCLYAPALLLAQLHGTVKEAPSGRPLAGATVKLKHSGLSAVTDSAGRFRLEAPGADTLLVSFVGYQHLALPVRPPFNTALELVLTSDQRELEEVTVSTGYQQLPRERATGSFDQVGAQLLNREVGSNILARLDGIASGLLFDKRGNAVSNISVRGLSTLSVGIKNPLIVLDNFPYQGDVNNINPQDVESVTVLKDAAAASIWGVSAGNGVIVITTKKGRLNQAMRISVTSAVTVSAKPDIFNTRPIATSDFIDAEQFLLGKGFYNSVLNNKTSRLVVSPVVELLAAARSGAISAEEAGSRIDALRGLDVRNDFEKYVYRKAVNQQHSIGVSGGSVNSTYQVSVGYDQNLQGLAGNRYDRVTVRDANTFRPLPGLDIQTAIQYTRSRTVSNSSGGYGTLATGGGKTALYPYAQLADAAGNPLAIPRDHRFSYIDTAGQGRLLDWRYRPLAETALADNRTRLNDLLLNLGARYRLLPFLSAEVKYQFENSQNSGRNYY